MKMSKKQTECKELLAEYRDDFLPYFGKECENFIEALKELYSLYTEKMPVWLGSLYDKEIGGFYYSVSARDNDGFLPDPDSTYQALRTVMNSGMTGAVGRSYGDRLPREMRDGVIRYLKSVQAENGYFYHPAMERETLDTKRTVRRSRDTQRATAVLRELGSAPTYDTPFGVVGDGIGADGKPVGSRAHTEKSNEGKEAKVQLDFLLSPEKFEDYLSSLVLINNSYSTGSHFNSQFYEMVARDREAIAAGENYSYVQSLISWLTENQLENGLWNERSDYAAVNGLMKIAGVYKNAGVLMPKSEAAALSAVEAIISAEPADAVTTVFNPWICAYRITSNMRRFGEESAADAVTARLRELAPLAIRRTAEKLTPFLKSDGGFSYLPDASAHVSSGAPAAVKGTAEGDVNATMLASVDTVDSIFSALGLEKHKVPIYSEEDFFRFIRATRCT